MRDQLQDTLCQGKTQAPTIQIEGMEPDPRRGYVQIPNYFLYYWVPLIGHKAAVTYGMILSFAHGNKDTCYPSLSRLCAHLGMTRKELTGRKRRIGKGRKIKEYHEKGTLEILQDHGLLSIEVHGNSLYAQLYTFKILKRPPLLTPEQLSRLPKSLQESHQRLIEKGKANGSKSRNSQASKEGIDNIHGWILPMEIEIEEKDRSNHSNPHNYQASKAGGDNVTGGVVTLSPVEGVEGGDIVTTNRTTTINRTTTTEPAPTPQGGAVVVVSKQFDQDRLQSPLSTTSESDASALNQLPAKDPISATPGLSPAGAPAQGPIKLSAVLESILSGERLEFPGVSVEGKSVCSPISGSNGTPTSARREGPSLICGPIFAPYTERIARDQLPRYGTPLVQQYVDWLEFQYRSRPPKEPFVLLAVSLKRGDLLCPQGFRSREELAAECLERQRRLEAARAAEAQERQQEEARRQREAQAQALWETLPEEEQARWVRLVAQEIPDVCRSMSEFMLRMLAQQRFLEQRASIG